MTSRTTTIRQTTVTVMVALAVLVSGYIHFYLYFRGGYRAIAPKEVVGLTISRAFALNAIGGTLIAEALMAALVVPRLRTPALLAAGGFALSTLVAYFVTRTWGLLGFTDNQTSTEAVIAVSAEIIALIGAAAALLSRTADVHPQTAR